MQVLIWLHFVAWLRVTKFWWCVVPIIVRVAVYLTYRCTLLQCFTFDCHSCCTWHIGVPLHIYCCNLICLFSCTRPTVDREGEKRWERTCQGSWLGNTALLQISTCKKSWGFRQGKMPLYMFFYDVILATWAVPEIFTTGGGTLRGVKGPGMGGRQ